MKLKCVVVDDEPLAQSLMVDYIKQVNYLQLLKVFDNPVDVISYLKSNKVDLLFLDIQMGKMSGIQLLQVLKNKPFVIFTTAFEKYALKGYELDVIDYLLKPISFERFVKAVDKVYELTKTPDFDPKTDRNVIANQKESYLFVKTGSKLQKVDFDEILFIEGLGEYLKIITLSGQVLTLQNFYNLSQVLPGGQFVRVHKSYMVSIDKIENIERNRIKIAEHLIPISNTFKKSFFDALNNKLVL